MIVDGTGLTWGRRREGGGGGGGDEDLSFTFLADGFTRTAHYQGNTTDPEYAWVWLDGGDDALGTTILNNVTAESDEVFVAPDGLTHKDATSTWIKSWTPEESVRVEGSSGATDLVMLQELYAVIRSLWPTVTTVFLGGYSGGGGLVMEYVNRSAPVYDGFFVFKRPLHESQVGTYSWAGQINGIVAVVQDTTIPMYLWLGSNDEHNDADEHVGRAGTNLAYVRAYTNRKNASPGITPLTIGGASCMRYNYGPRYNYIHELRGGHEWVSNCEGRARTFLRGG